MFSYASKSITAILTSLYLLLSVGSCADTRQEEAYSPAVTAPVESEVRSVNVLHSASDLSYELQQVLDRYAETRGGDVAFQVQSVNGRESYRSALRSRLLSGEQADLFHILDVSDVDRLEAYLEDLSALSWLEEAYSGSLDTVTVDNRVYGVPYSLEGVGLIVRRDIFEAAGIPLAGITDFESLGEAFTGLQEQINAGELTDSFPELTAVTDLAGQDTGYLSGVVSELLLAESFRSTQQAFYSPTADFPAGEDGEQMLRLLARVSPQSNAWREILNVTQSRMIDGGIVSGRVAAILHSTESMGRILAADPDLADKLTLLPLYYENSEEGFVFAGPSAWWAVNRDADDEVKAIATGFLEWLYTSPEGLTALSDLLGIASPLPGVTDGNSVYRQLRSAVEAGNSLPRLSADAPDRWGEEVFVPQIKEYFTEFSKEWEDVLASCKEGWAQMRGGD